MMKPLITPDELKTLSNDPQLILLDATIPKVGQAEEDLPPAIAIPNAQLMNLKADFCDATSGLPNTVPTVAQFEKSAQQLGVHKDSKVVVYDRHGIYSSPRAWWLFLLMGHTSVSVLQGGLPAWISAGYATEKLEDAAVRPKGNFQAEFQAHRFVNADDLMRQLSGDTSPKPLFDARSALRFEGATPEPREGMRAGHIPRSKNIHYAKVIPLLEKGDKEGLKAVFQEYPTSEMATVFTCGSGITACILALGATVLGHQDWAVYDGSWSEWGASDRPIAQGKG